MTQPTPPPRRAYPSDLSNEEWAAIEPLIPPAKAHPNLQVPLHSRREIMNAIRYRTRTGCSWRMLPHDFPPWHTVYNTYDLWAKTGVMKDINDEFAARARTLEGRGEEPTAAILDSQSVKGTVQSRDCGYDAGKKVKGRKRHVLVDTLGFILALAITPASVQDRDMAGPVVERALLEHSYIHKVWADGIYTGQVIEDLRQTVDIEVVKRPRDASGFVVLPRRWVVERTFGWMERFRLLSREYERTVSSSTADIYCAMSMILARRITSAYRSSAEHHGSA